ncbi:MAG TPA: GYF domain-containing protein [Polyangiales bacterium]|nr:GYF domain-containing protein [Polyangiales bacterium]
MKIVCGSCQAKYSIADEKVAGKVFRIRCKRCGEVIVVRGDQDSPEANVTVAANGNGQAAAAQAPAAAAAEAPSDAIWHVVINGEQAGPYSPAQLGELVASGQLDWEAYVWSEGFENWLPMRDVPDLVSAISGGQAAPVAMGRPPQTAANTQMGADPFPEEAPAQQQVFAKAAGGGGGGSVVDTNPRMHAPATALSSFDSGGPSMGSSAQSPRVSQQQAMTGARNENSVLFSLKNLQALATGSVPPPASPLSGRPGHAAGEGSGLIDIRALATTTGVAEPSRNSEKDALLALGSAQGGAFGGLGSPMLAAPGKADEESNKKPLIFAIIGGCALLAIALVAFAMIMRGSSAPPAEVAPIAPAAAPSAAVPAAQPSAAPSTAQPAEELSEGEKAAQAAAAAKAAETAAKPAEEAPKPGTPTHSAAAPKHTSSSERAPEPAAAAPVAKTPEAPPEKKKSGSLDELLNDAIGGKSNSLGSKPAAADLPEKPSRDDVLKAMKGVTDAVKACGKGQTGVAFANVTVIGKTGRVSNAEITGITGEAGSCIASAVRKASFPKFSSENFQVKFPFRL